MTRFVLDASVALAWFFEDEFTTYADAVSIALLRDGAIAPTIWPLEMTNAMLNGARRGRFPVSQVPSMIDALRRLPVDIDQDLSPMALAQAASSLGLRHRLSAYDASYLELALRRGLALATLDDRLVRAANVAGAAILDPSIT